MRNSDSAVAITLEAFNRPDCLIYGIGNAGRQDDGLGWAFIDWLEREPICPKAELLRNYQLFLEDADLISQKRRVLFVDASKSLTLQSFSLSREAALMDFSFTSHALSIPTLMATCQTCFDYLPEVWVLAIRGYEWELKQGLTGRAEINLDHAIAALTD
ncbi:hydrogenase maturation protease [Marinobacterium jannaschii]|uniref:hydrogenase maturation protease n=1 Tax=Marinobacterium jannaschii TaxID=64970 RepID=UPI0006881AEB|nr:hydrogenase maturation protease [Marinobacterium jannaschii]